MLEHTGDPLGGSELGNCDDDAVAVDIAALLERQVLTFAVEIRSEASQPDDV